MLLPHRRPGWNLVGGHDGAQASPVIRSADNLVEMTVRQYRWRSGGTDLLKDEARLPARAEEDKCRD